MVIENGAQGESLLAPGRLFKDLYVQSKAVATPNKAIDSFKC